MLMRPHGARWSKQAQVACIGIASINHSKIATAEAIFWEAIAAFVIRVRTTSPTPQNTGPQRNAALARSSGAAGHLVNVRYWPKADIAIHSHICTNQNVLLFETHQASWWAHEKAGIHRFGCRPISVMVGGSPCTKKTFSGWVAPIWR